MAGVPEDKLEVPVAHSPELWRTLAAQVAAAIIVRAAAARIHAPEHLREALTEQRLASRGNPSGSRRR
jgi:hypothetical protein